MRQVQCPSCERKLAIPDTVKGKVVRCPSCKEKVNLDDAGILRDEERADRSPRAAAREGPSRPARTDRREAPAVRKRSTVRDDEFDDEPEERPAHRRGGKYYGLIPLLILLPVGVVLLILAPRYKEAARWSALLGFALMIVATYFVYRCAKKKGLDKEFDSIPGFLRGGGALIVYQVKFAIQFPKLMASWVTLELFGMAVMITGGILFESVNWAAKEKPYVPPPDRGTVNVTGDAGIDKLLTELEEPSKCQAVAEKLAQLKPDEHQAEVAAKLAVVTQNPNNFVRKSAIKALGVWATPKEIPVLMQWFKQFGTRSEAAEALRKVGSAAEDAVRELLKHRDGREESAVCHDAIGVLKDIGTKNSVPDLQEVAATANGYLAGPAQEALNAIAARNK